MTGDVLAGSTILVTGAARSLGAAFAEYFAARGASVWRTDIDAGDGVRRLDVTKRSDWEATVADITESGCRIDGLVNNAGVYYGMRPFWDEADDEFDRMIDVNLKGTWLGTQIVSKSMAADGKGGSIVNLSSTSGVMASKGFAGYGTTRWGVRGLSKWAAAELAGHRIRVNSLHPHSVYGTGMMTSIAESLGLSSADVEKLGAANPLGRMGTTDDVAAMATFLLCDQSSFITGREFVVDGGVTLGGAN
jgi:3alpha(or 20beta)-hydroxysteroid dehydrogenase